MGWQLTQPAGEGAVDLHGAGAAQRHDEDQARGALHEGADAGLAAGALHEVTLPVPGQQARGGLQGAQIDGGDVLQGGEAALAQAAAAAAAEAVAQPRSQGVALWAGW